jgi:hypothetical protein
LLGQNDFGAPHLGAPFFVQRACGKQISSYLGLIAERGFQVAIVDDWEHISK